MSERDEHGAAQRRTSYVGRPVKRREDYRHLTGRSQFIADLQFEGLAHLEVLRAPYPFASIESVATEDCRSMPGVLGVWTGTDVVRDGLGPIPWERRPPAPPGTDPAKLGPPGDPSLGPPQPVLASELVRYLGEPVAAVVAETAAQAEAAAERIAVQYAPRQPVIDARRALDPDAVELHPEFPGNVCFRLALGNRQATSDVFRSAAHVVELSVHNQRLVQNPLETRGYVGRFDAESGCYTLYAAAGKPQSVGLTLASHVFRIPDRQVRVITKDVGGGFGAKNTLYPEEALVLWTAQKTGRPVRWLASRSESFLSDVQGRDQSSSAALALDAAGRILALKVDTVANLGGYLGPRGVTPPTMPASMLTSVYDIPAVDFQVAAVFSNTTPTCPYRGAGAPEAIFVLERLIDLAAREMDLPQGEIRRKNLIRSSTMPHTTALGSTYDSGDFIANMQVAEDTADVTGFGARRVASEARGWRRGLGYANVLEACNPAIGDKALVACAVDGAVTVRIGTMSNGQSHETVYAQLLADRLDIDIERVRLIQGDSWETPWGKGTGACRSMTVGGSALVLAADALIESGLELAAELLEAAAADIEYRGGGYRVSGTDRGLALESVAEYAVAHGRAGERGLEAGFEFTPFDSTYPNGCHIAEVEVDPETGEVRLVAYSCGQDVGKALNPMVVAGQLQGGVAQGVGQALMEGTVFAGDSGQLLTGSFMDYAMPRAADLPRIESAILEVPCRHTPTGAKSVGEAGPTAAPPAVINAIIDALWPLGVRHIEMPATPQTVFEAIRSAKEKEEC